VLKPLFTSKARGMAVVEHGPDAQNSLEHFKAENTVMYIQKKVSIPGRDLGIVFLGGEYVGTYARVAPEHTWNTTTHYGGTYEPFTPKPRLIDLAHSAQSLFGLDFTCVDIAEAPEGPLVFEVSAFGGFRGLFEANKIDAARLYTEYVIRKLNHG
jgi:ribosomal protein S6--L-glutamate ligase